jgi:protoporphyrinogen oxidase
MYKARRSGAKKEMFGYVEGGYRTIIETMEKELRCLGVTIKTGCPTKKVEKGNDGQFTIEYAGDEADEKFDRVIMTTPNAILERTCVDLSDEEKQKFSNIDYLGIVCASLLLKKPLSVYYVTNLTDAWVPMTAVIEMTTIVDPEELGGNSLVYLPKYVPAEHEMFDKTDEEVKESFLSALERMYPDFTRDDVMAFEISRVRNVMAIPTLRYSEKLPPMKTSVDGLYIVNSSYILKGNLNVNESITIAEEAMDTVLQAELGNVTN